MAYIVSMDPASVAPEWRFPSDIHPSALHPPLILGSSSAHPPLNLGSSAVLGSLKVRSDIPGNGLAAVEQDGSRLFIKRRRRPAAPASCAPLLRNVADLS